MSNKRVMAILPALWLALAIVVVPPLWSDRAIDDAPLLSPDRAMAASSTGEAIASHAEEHLTDPECKNCKEWVRLVLKELRLSLPSGYCYHTHAQRVPQAEARRGDIMQFYWGDDECYLEDAGIHTAIILDPRDHNEFDVAHCNWDECYRPPGEPGSCVDRDDLDVHDWLLRHPGLEVAFWRFTQEVVEEGATLFEDAYFSGDSWNFTQSDGDLCDNVIDWGGNTPGAPRPCDIPGVKTMNDIASSLKMASGWEARLHIHNAQDAERWGDDATQGFHCGSDMVDFADHSFPNGTPLNDNASRVLVARCAPTAGASLSLSASQDDICRPDPGPCVEGAHFTDVESYPDGTVVQPDQSMDKWWRVQNSGTCDWDGYQLIFESGEQMGGPSPVVIPYTPAGQTVDIHVPMQAPSASGEHAGYWRIVSPTGVWVDGGRVWITVQVEPDAPPSSTDIDLVDVDHPSVVTPGQSFRPTVTVRVNQGQLLESRGDMLRNTDGNLYGAWPHVAVVGAVSVGQTYTFEFYENDPITAPQSEGTYYSRWRVWRDGNWAGPEIEIRFDVRAGGGTRPDPPTLVSPGNWYVSRDGSTPTLCASAPGGLQYYFQIYESHDIPESGWISSSCWTPPTLGPYGYQWHVRVRDPGSELESDWSETWHFNIDSQELTIDALEFQPDSPSDAEEIRVYTCVHGFGGIGLGLKIEANTATDCSADGEWQWIHHLGTFCYDPTDAGTWPNWSTRSQPDGNHLVRATGYHGSDTIVTEACYQLNYRRPPDVQRVSPLPGTWWNSRQINFDWQPALRTDDYRLLVGTYPDPTQDPIVDIYLDPSTTEYSHTFGQDYEILYWKVIASNSRGSGEAGPARFGIDRAPPDSNVSGLTELQYEPHFVVSWDGADDRSGVRWYDVQYRDGERGEWISWLTRTDAAVAMFHGEPGHTYCFRSRAMDTAGNWEPYPSGDGDVCTTVDVTAAPSTPWWDTDYASKRNIVILNNDARALPAGYPVHLHFDSTTNPTAAELYASSLSATKGDDFRIVLDNITEQDRWIQSFDADSIDIWFNSQVEIGGESSDSSTHQLYSGNPGASNPPGAMYPVFAVEPDASTVGLWPFQEGSGTTVADVSGHGNDGTFVNSPTWADGKFGTSLCFDNEINRVSIPDSNSLDVQAITVEGWLKFVYHRDNWKIFDKGDEMWLDDFRDGIRYALKDVYGHGSDALHAVEFSPQQWHHFAFTYDGAGHVRVYRDGTLEYARDNPNGVSGPLATNSVPLRIGGAPVCLQHLRMSNVARTNFSYGRFALLTAEPSLAAGAAQEPPVSGSADLVLQRLSAYPAASGLEGGTTVQAVFANEGDRATDNGFFTDLYADHLPTGPGDYSGSVHFWIAQSIEPGSTVTVTTVLTETQSALLAASVEGAIAESSSTLYAQVDSTGVVGEPDDQNNISSGTEVCVASDDTYEPDNSYAVAQPISGVQTHNVGTLADEDWVSFQAEQGQEYLLMTSNLGPNADTYLYLYDTDGETLLAANDDYGGTLASKIQWVAPATGTYYVAVKHWNPNVSGCGTSYDLSATEQFTRFFPLVMKGHASISALGELPPTATPTPSAKPTSTPVSTSTFTATPTLTDSATTTPDTPSPTPTATLTSTLTATPTATATSTPMPTPTSSHTPTPTNTPTATPAEAVIPTPTEVPTPSATPEQEP